MNVTAPTAAPPASRKPLYKSLFFQILVAVVAGILIGREFILSGIELIRGQDVPWSVVFLGTGVGGFGGDGPQLGDRHAASGIRQRLGEAVQRGQ